MSYNRTSAPSIPSPEITPTADDSLSGYGERRPDAPITWLELFSLRLGNDYVVPVSGGLAGAVSGVVSCPLDVIKTKLQAQGGFKIPTGMASLSTAAYHGVKGTAKVIWKEEGLRGMYRGLGPMLLGYVPTWAVYLTVYSKAQGYFNTKTDSKFFANIYASVAGGACSTMVTNPIWVIKTRLMSQSGSISKVNHSRPPWYYRNTLDAARKMYRIEGIRSFYSGLTPALFGLTHVAIQFPLYEVFKQKFTGLPQGVKESEQEHDLHWRGIAFAIFLSKVCASTATYPHEVVRTRLQTQQRSTQNQPTGGVSGKGGDKGTFLNHSRSPHGAPANGVKLLRYRGTIQTCKVILAEEGWRGFYAGLGTNLIRAVPSAMTTLLTYEYLKKTIYQQQGEGKRKLAHLEVGSL